MLQQDIWLRSSAGRTLHRKKTFDHGILVVAAARDRLHGGGVKPAIDDEAVVDMHANHLTEHHMTIDRLAVERLKRDDLDASAFECARAGLHTRRLDQSR